MPADRTERTSAASFVESQTFGLPLSSHGAKHAPSIARGLACQTCRKRKLKCDGVRPLCGACAKSAVIHGDDVDDLVCSYDDPTARRKRAPATSAAKVAALEAEIAELKAALHRTRLESPPSASTSSATSDPCPPANAGPFVAYDGQSLPSDPSADLDLLASTAAYPSSTSTNRQTSASIGYSHAHGAAPLSSEPWGQSASVPELSPSGAYSSAGDTSPPFTPPSDPLFELFYPGWPRDLPAPELTHRLLDVYFARPHMCIGVVDANRFRAALMLPPTSAGFPHPGLIHIMCAVATLMVPDDFVRNEAYWRSQPKPVDYHVARCKVAMEAHVDDSNKLFQTVQCYSLMCYVLYTQARWVELWSYCGQATRLAAPLGLNHVRAASDVPMGAGAHVKGVLLHSTDDESVLTERAMTFFLTLFADRAASACTGWSCSISDIDITTIIPAKDRPYPRGDDLANSPLSIHNAAFFTSHPPHLCGPQQLFHKAIVLLGKVVQFQQRAPYIGITSGAGSALQNSISDMRTTDAFKRTDLTIRSFMASIPREHQFQHRALGTGAADVLNENRLCLVYGIVHSSTILLHEPYVSTLDEDEPSLLQCVASANAIVQSIFSILGTSYEIALLSPFITYIWASAGRVFIRQMALKMVKGITQGLDELKSNVNTILVVLKAHRTPLGDNTHETLKIMFDDPMRCLPRNFLSFTNVDPNLLPCREPLRTTPVQQVLAAIAAASSRAGQSAGVSPSEAEQRFYELPQQQANRLPPPASTAAVIGGPVPFAAPTIADGTAMDGRDGFMRSALHVETSFAATLADLDGSLQDLSMPLEAGHILDPMLQSGAGKPSHDANVEVPTADWYTRQGLQGLEQLLQMQ